MKKHKEGHLVFLSNPIRGYRRGFYEKNADSYVSIEKLPDEVVLDYHKQYYPVLAQHKETKSIGHALMMAAGSLMHYELKRRGYELA